MESHFCFQTTSSNFIRVTTLSPYEHVHMEIRACTVWKRSEPTRHDFWSPMAGEWIGDMNIMMSWRENAFAFVAIARGIHRWPMDSPHKGPVMKSFDVFFVVSLNKLLNKLSNYFLHNGPVTHSFCVFFVVNLNKLLKKPSSCLWVETPWHSK